MRAANIWCFLQVPNYYILLLKAKGKEKKGVKTKKNRMQYHPNDVYYFLSNLRYQDIL